MGLGLLGRGVGDAVFLAENGADIIVTDLKTEEELKESVEKLRRFTNVTFHVGGHDRADFQDRDFILKGPTVPIDSPYLAEARKNGVPIKMSASWFAEISGIPIVGVTGTRGKSTTTQLLYEIIKAAGLEVLLGGNVRGVSTLALLPNVTENSIALMELDSWQLAGFGEIGLSPQVSVFTTFFPDHLNYYGSIHLTNAQDGEQGRATSLTTGKAMDAYLEDKAQIFLNQKSDDTLIVSTQVAPILKEKYGKKIISRVIVADLTKFPKGWTLQIPGEHNKLNAMCAIEAARALGIDDELSQKALAEFKGMSGRLELVREVRGVKIYNDTTATTPEATLAALHALRQGSAQNLILIMGGADKGLDMSTLTVELSKCKKVLLLSGTGTDRIKIELPDTMIYHSVSDALRAALAIADAGDIVLFSPAFASFGMFKNEFDRGDQFVKLVQELQ